MRASSAQLADLRKDFGALGLAEAARFQSLLQAGNFGFGACTTLLGGENFGADVFARDAGIGEDTLGFFDAGDRIGAKLARNARVQFELSLRLDELFIAELVSHIDDTAALDAERLAGGGMLFLNLRDGFVGKAEGVGIVERHTGGGFDANTGGAGGVSGTAFFGDAFGSGAIGRGCIFGCLLRTADQGERHRAR